MSGNFVALIVKTSIPERNSDTELLTQKEKSFTRDRSTDEGSSLRSLQYKRTH